VRVSPAGRWLLLGIVLAAALPQARGQAVTPVDRLKDFDEPESIRKKLEKEKAKPPFEFFRSQVAPFDATPYVKAHHWSALSLEMRANLADYDGLLQTTPIGLHGMPKQVVYRRAARLVKEQQSRLGFQVMLPVLARTQEQTLELTRPDTLRPDGLWSATLMRLETHQMLIMVLAKEPGAYMPWRKLQAVLPPSRQDLGTGSFDSRLYYRFSLPLDPEKPLVSSHPLTWTAISHVIWDGQAPETLNPSQQQAMLDWLHWGGQLTILAGAGPKLALLRESFLGPYLPADPSGENGSLTEADLMPMARAYPPPATTEDWPDLQATPVPVVPTFRGMPPSNRPDGLRPLVRYKRPVPIRPAPKRPVFLTGLVPREGASTIPLGEENGRVLGAEWRVGRGRVTLLGVNLTDPAFAAWPGLDTFVRRVVLRRVEDTPMPDGDSVRPLSGPELTSLRFLSRDLEPRPVSEGAPEEVANNLPQEPVGAWLDSAKFPTTSRYALEDASGVSIPGKPFVLKVILAYLVALVPLNWLLCRFVLRRRELAWVVAPILAIGFAVAVERGAANELGFDSASDEIDLLEVQSNYPRAHLTRCVALYSTGRVKFTVGFPGDLTALALPMNTGGALLGDEVTQTVWNSSPRPSLEGFLVQPRSLAMYRAEQMSDLHGSIVLASAGTPRKVLNRTDQELRDATIIEEGRPPVRLGTIPPGGFAVEGVVRDTGQGYVRWTAPETFLNALQSYSWHRPEDAGEIRLVAWSDGARKGQTITPSVDRTRGLTLVVAHLRYGPPPRPDGPAFYGGAKEAARP